MSNLKKCLLVLFAAFVLFSLNAADKHQLKVSLNKPNGIYTKGDTVELKIEYFLNRKPAKCPVNIVMVFPDGSRKEQPNVQGAVAAPVQEGLEEPSHVEGQEGRHWRYPSSKVRSSGCALLEQP